MASVEKSYLSPSDAKSTFGDLYWPTAVPNKIDMLKIDIVKFVPISKSGLVATSTASAAPSSSGTSSPTATTSNANTFISNIQSVNTGKEDILSTLLLPVPEGITYADQPQWSEERIGAMGKLAGALASQAAGGNAESVGKTLSQLAAAGMGPYVLKQIEKFGGPTAEAITQGAGGVVLNPYVEQIFKGIGMRNFSFSWKLVPRNKDEQLRIHNIIKALRYFSLPNYTATSGIVESQQDATSPNELTSLGDRWLTVPNIFKLRWVHQSPTTDIQSLPKIKPCVLKNVTVNYTPDGVWASHIVNGQQLTGPAPIAYTLQLEFSETEIITANDVLSINGAY